MCRRWRGGVMGASWWEGEGGEHQLHAMEAMATFTRLWHLCCQGGTIGPQRFDEVLHGRYGHAK